jgi:hypothetical protein
MHPSFAYAAMRRIFVVAFFFLIAHEAHAEERWTTAPFGVQGADPAACDTFRLLLEQELTTRLAATFVASPNVAPCADASCALALGAGAGAGRVLYGSLRTLGQKLIVIVSVAHVADGRIGSSHKMVVDRVEDLELAATRIAAAIAAGTSTDDTADVGTITQSEATTVHARRTGRPGLAIRIGSMVPIGKSAREADYAGLLDLSYWYEARDFAIEPRFGVRLASDRGTGTYFESLVDVGASYMLGRGDFAPFVGLGGGLHYFAEETTETIKVGTALEAESETLREDTGFGVGAYARAGVLLFRTYTMRVGVTAEVSIVRIELNQVKNPRSLNLGVGLVF